MGKLVLVFLSAAAGFVAAVAATPEDAEKTAYDRGYAAGTRALQAEAVQNGYAAWESGTAPEATPTFRWGSRRLRSRGDRDWAEHQPRNGSPRQQTEERPNRDLNRDNPEIG